ncbi:MAG: dihydrodipicolinate synthase family protein [Sedimentisphaerales bacterium]|nr:dihydrodipicolinate synthase family protein [Sedimentisphaerales bacterium]
MHLEGLIAAPFTAMKADRSINLDMIEKQAAFYAANGVAGVFVCGTTGEGLLLTVQERLDIADVWCQVALGTLKVIVHVGENSVDACCQMAARAQRAGAYAVGAMAPNFFRPATVEVLVDYCAEIAASAPKLPFYYYHMPSMTGVNFAMIDFLKKASGRIPNLAGIKYTYEDMMDYQLCRVFEDGRYDILFGRDEMLLCGLVLGTRGAVGSTYNFAAPLYCRLIDEFRKEHLDKARQYQLLSMQMIKILATIGCPFLSASKALMKYLGVDCGPVRLPLTDISAAQFDSMIARLEQIGLSDFCSRQPAPVQSDVKRYSPVSGVRP